MLWILFLLQAAAHPTASNTDFDLVVAQQPERDRQLADKRIAEAQKDPVWPYVVDGKISAAICRGEAAGFEGPVLSDTYLDRIAKRLNLTVDQRKRLESDCTIWSAGYSNGWSGAENLAENMREATKK